MGRDVERKDSDFMELDSSRSHSSCVFEFADLIYISFLFYPNTLVSTFRSAILFSKIFASRCLGLEMLFGRWQSFDGCMSSIKIYRHCVPCLSYAVSPSANTVRHNNTEIHNEGA